MAETKEEQVAWTPEEEKALVRKIDLKLIPWIMVLYLCSYLDRVNIGNAKVANQEVPGSSMEATLGLNSDQYSWSVAIFFFGYVIFEVPSNILMKVYSPSKWLARIMVTWGICATCMAAVSNFPGLLAARFFLGLMEAGSFPGFIYYYSFWYKQQEQATRVAIFFSMASIAGAFSGLLASAISFLNNKGGLEGWRDLTSDYFLTAYLLNKGLPSIIVGVFVYFLLPDFPQTELKWLSDRERHIAVNRMPPTAPSHLHKHFELHELKATLFDPWTWLFNFAYFCCVCPLYSVSYFNPTIIKNLGYVSYIAQLMTVPPYAAAFVWTIGLGLNSDRTHERALHVSASLVVGIVGFIMQLALDVQANTGAKYFGVFLATIGPFGTIPCINTFRTKTMRGTATSGAVATAAMVASGNIGGIVSPFLYPNWAGPQYKYGTITNIVLMGLGIVSMLILRQVYKDVEEGILVEGAASEEFEKKDGAVSA
ncbi:MFS general substrate transporter [Gonapodya prolifera JEL478]|uniref:MFS general substrate transporter n=1 Tax=Gonapodya prolifera (strain JEL478) TaxID=1344416 RepID=A0A139AXG2_GONPJ|nr:MFS general substrate transporter [Gonapodya prolifera JEL478]|eukprot:KXS21263.1 MFS general substrate transporter [Gonapodya prolifera JEL478]